LAYAYAQDNVCMFADSLLTARGERSQFFGADAAATRRANGEYGAASDFMDLKNEDSDFFFKGYLDLEQLKAAYAAASKEARDMLEGYAAGYNRYLKDYAGKLPAACNNAKWVRPISVEDMYLVVAEKALHASGEVFAKEIVAAARDGNGDTITLARAPSRKADTSFLATRLAQLSAEKLGSNGLAIGKDLTASGRGMLLGNPHYPWTSTDRFYQAHLTVPGRYDAMGVILGGVPMVVIGFNKDVAWTHTVTTAVHFTTFKLALDVRDTSGTSYFTDGAPVKMTSKTVSVDSLQPDGSLSKRTKTFFFSKQGAVLVKPEAGIMWTRTTASVLADPNRNNTRLIEQWIGIGSAKTVQELKASLDKTIGLPWINTIAADRAGNTLYADASVVPRVSTDKFASDCLVTPPLLMFDGSRSACAWGQDAGAPDGIFSPVNGPWMIRSDYVGNSNDSYWLTNPRALYTGPAPFGFSPLYGAVGVEQKLRTRIGFKQMEEAVAQQRRFQLSDLQGLAYADRIYAAELVLPQFLPICLASNDRALLPACNVLAAWDKRSNLDSRGAVLFREFWNIAAAIPDKWAVPLDPADPVNTPNGVNPAAGPAMLAALRSAVLRMQTVGVPLDGRLGDYQDDTRNGVRVALHGAIGDIDGSYNSIHMTSALDASGYHDIMWGTSYVQTVTFDAAGPVAQAMLVYGQSVDPKSPWYADQVPLYAQKQWPTLPFSADRIKADPHYTVRTLAE
ncbi:MAG TPA: penicillin acylase family protein, partial [Telluria sp.]|nr:penicillin acylase family protein [Telluria sp.]